MSLSNINVELFIRVPKPPPNPFFLDTNGVTIKLKDGFPAGTIGKADNDFSGKVYTAVNNTSLFALDQATDDFSSICTTLCTNFTDLFQGTTSNPSTFNQNISSWDTSNVVLFTNMFQFNISFNQPIGFWNTEKVTNMRHLFRGFPTSIINPFNQDISNWDTSLVTNMERMFQGNNSFARDISSWCVELIPTEPPAFGNAFLNANPSFKPNWGAPC